MTKIDKILEDVFARFCDEFCKYPEQGEMTDERIEEICSKCPFVDL